MKRKAKRIISMVSKEAKKSSKSLIEIHDGMGTTMPPDKDVLLIYFEQKGEGELADQFYNEHVNRRWKTTTGGTIQNWKVCAAEWIYNYRLEVKRRFRQSPFYSESF